MGSETNISWCDKTFNPWWSCEKCSPGCLNCYAEAWAKRCGFDCFGPGKDPRRFGDAYWKGPIRWNYLAARSNTRYRVFCGSMCDIFQDRYDVGNERERLWNLIRITPFLDWMLLTKRPEFIPDFMPKEVIMNETKNIMIGVTAENQEMMDTRLPHILRLPFRKFVSIEPMLSEIDLGFDKASKCCKRWGSRWIRLPRTVRADFPGIIEPSMKAIPGIYRAESNPHGALSVQTPSGLLGVKPDEFEVLPKIDFVVCGGESGPHARSCDLAWIRSVVRQCKDAGVPIHVKQLGRNPVGEWYGRPLKTADTPLMKNQPLEQHPFQSHDGIFCLNDREGRNQSEWPEDLRIKEFPKEAQL